MVGVRHHIIINLSALRLQNLKAKPEGLEKSSPSATLVGASCVVGVSQGAAKADVTQEGSHVPSMCLLSAFEDAHHSTEDTAEQSLTSSNPDIISLQVLPMCTELSSRLRFRIGFPYWCCTFAPRLRLD